MTVITQIIHLGYELISLLILGSAFVTPLFLLYNLLTKFYMDVRYLYDKKEPYFYRSVKGLTYLISFTMITISIIYYTCLYNVLSMENLSMF